MWYLIVGLQIKLSREKNSIYFFYLNNRLLPHLCKFVPPRIPHSATILMCKPKINHRRRWSSYSMTECCRNWSNAICFGISRNHFVTSVSWNFMVSIGCCGILCYGGKFFFPVVGETFIVWGVIIVSKYLLFQKNVTKKKLIFFTWLRHDHFLSFVWSVTYTSVDYLGMIFIQFIETISYDRYVTLGNWLILV